MRIWLIHALISGTLPSLPPATRLRRRLHVLHAAPLRPHLHHAIVFARRIAHHLALADGLAERLLDVNVLARLQRLQASGWRASGPAPRSSRHRYLYRRGRRWYSLMSCGLLPCAFSISAPVFSSTAGIEIAERLELAARLNRAQRVSASLVAAADQRQRHLLIGAHRRGVQIQETARRRSGLQKCSSGIHIYLAAGGTGPS